MRLFELFLIETSEEDRAIVSLASAIYDKLKDEHIGYEPDYTDEDQNLVDLGKIGNMFNTSIPVLDNIGLELQGGEPFIRRANSKSEDEEQKLEKVMGIWDDTTYSIVLNLDYLTAGNLRTVITHELRHALDDIKSDEYKVKSPKNQNNKISGYFIPKSKRNRKDDPYHPLKKDISYRAQPAEINARFTEVLDELSTRIPSLVTKYGDESFNKAMIAVRNLFTTYKIADIYPEKTASPDYKRLFKRAADFAEKEIAHVKQGMGIADKPHRPNLPK